MSMKNVLIFSLLFCASLPLTVYSHCQVPCGIYDDPARIIEIKEDILTIEKAMTQIVALSKEGNTHDNQIVRWVMAKENHADNIQTIMSQYFLAQKVKPVTAKDKEKYAEYLRKLELIHQMTVLSMNAKQTTDLNIVTKLRSTIKKFESVFIAQ